MLLFILVLPMVFQGLVFVFDEIVHLKRGLGKFERYGHPIDTLSVLSAVSVPVFFDLNYNTLIAFLLLSMFSCVLVTKDEFIHFKSCDFKEQFLHALLFVLHPWIFVSSFSFWFAKTSQSLFDSNSLASLVLMEFRFFGEALPSQLLLGQWISTSLVFLYQTLKWIVFYKHQNTEKVVRAS